MLLFCRINWRYRHWHEPPHDDDILTISARSSLNSWELMVPLVHPCNGSIILRVLPGSPVEMWLKAILRFHLQPNRINQHRACIKFHDATSLRSYMMECTFSGLRSYVFRVYSRSAMEGIVFLLFNLMDGKAHIWPNEHKNSLIWAPVLF